MADIANSAQDMENTRKSTRLKQQHKFEKSMSSFIAKAKKGKERSYDTSTEEDEPEMPAVPEKIAKKEIKRQGPKLSARAKPKPAKEMERKTSTSAEEEEAEEESMSVDVDVDANEKSFNLGMLDLRRVGDDSPSPRKDKEPIQLNRRGMPQRIRKRNRLFFDDHVVTSSVTKTRIKRETPVKGKDDVKRPVVKSFKKEGMKKEEIAEVKPPVDDAKENNIVRQKIGMTLRNLLKLPKAQRWVFYEWFYSNIDRVLFFGSNDFLMCLKENFVDLKTTVLRKTEWCVLRRLLGKPRRCSQAFFREERRTLEKKRNQIRAVQQRKIRDLSLCKDLPDRIPLHLSVNSRVTARLRKPQAGLFTGKVDAVDPSNHTYRITFDRPGLGTHSIPDYEVLMDGEPDMMSISNLAKRYINASARSSAPRVRTPSLKATPVAEKYDYRRSWADNIAATQFPKSFFEMILRICKILKEKRVKVDSLKDMHGEAERMLSTNEEYPLDFQRRYASIIVELESLNISLERYLTTVENCCNELAPEASMAAMLAPSYLREKSLSEAKTILEKAFDGKDMLKNKELLNVVLELTALMIQVQTLQDSKHSVHERQILKQSLGKIKGMISPNNHLVFQNNVQVHIQYIESSLSQQKETPS